MPAKGPNIPHLLSQLQREPAIEPVAGAPLAPEMALLRRWQSQRLSRTYADLLADPRYAPACEFFLSDIYAPRDFSQRDHELESLYAFLRRFLPEAMLELAADTVALNRLSNRLDADLLCVLVEQLGVTEAITADQYAEAYRLCANYPARVRQIEMLVRVIKEVTIGSRHPLVGASLRLSHLPAVKAGLAELHGYMQRGVQAFKPMGGSLGFAEVIETREMEILDRIYQGEADLFGP
jgi:hypothetical protein